ncbi:MAG: cob(I)yrinic acid a,c-diamide adenosyltransferase [Candidatus Woesearchaeota archaeon]|nr:cob(I)yrinic acid a,c-diamide adenosyltransferase [Candidatus Woesearchaeota archaeon]
MIYTFCGETKGKTSSALGTIVRALGDGGKVRILFFMKHWKTSETDFFDKLAKIPEFDVLYYQAGDKDFIFVDEATNRATMESARKQLKFGKLHEKTEEDVKKAQMGYMKALNYLDEQPFLLVLDEILVAVKFGLISVQQVRHLLEQANEKKVHVVLTGRGLPKEIEKLSDLVTEMKKIKHPFDSGVYAVKGLDY